jgi:hypothetical protein
MFENVDPKARWEISRQLEYDLEYQCDEEASGDEEARQLENDQQLEDISSDSEDEPKAVTTEQ